MWTLRTRLLLLCTMVVLAGFLLQAVLTGALYQRMVEQYSAERLGRLTTFLSGVMQWWFDSDLVPDAGDQQWLKEELGPALAVVYEIDPTTLKYHSKARWQNVKGAPFPLDPDGLQKVATEAIQNEHSCICGPYRISTRREWKYVVQVALPLSLDQQNLQGFQQRMLLIGGLSFLLVGVLAFLLAQGLIRPLMELSRQARQLDRADPFAHQQRQDEVGVLARALQEGVDQVQQARARERQFLAAASHELRTPIGALLVSIEQDALQARSVQDHQNILQRVHRTALRLRDLSGNLLTLMRPQDRTPWLPIDFTQLVADTVDELMPLAAQQGLWIDFQAEKVQVQGDPHALRQMVTNLLANSIKFTQEGHILVQLEVQQQGALLVVQDTGVGLPTGNLDLFAPFVRGPRATQQVAGSGLGLAVVKEVLERHQGRISLEAGPEGVGTRATVWLPAQNLQQQEGTHEHFADRR